MRKVEMKKVEVNKAYIIAAIVVFTADKYIKVAGE